MACRTACGARNKDCVVMCVRLNAPCANIVRKRTRGETPKNKKNKKELNQPKTPAAWGSHWRRPRASPRPRDALEAGADRGGERPQLDLAPEAAAVGVVRVEEDLRRWELHHVPPHELVGQAPGRRCCRSGARSDARGGEPVVSAELVPNRVRRHGARVLSVSVPSVKLLENLGGGAGTPTTGTTRGAVV